MKFIANYISISRILLSLALIFTKPLSIDFFVIYILCGVSDILDGYIARKTNTISELGGKLDSVGDLIMVMVLMILLYPIINPTLKIILWISIIAIIKVISIMVVFIKYKTFEILHTYGNKFTGLMLFAFPVSIVWVQSDITMYIICMIASISAIEELLINLLSNELRINKKSIFLNNHHSY